MQKIGGGVALHVLRESFRNVPADLIRHTFKTGMVDGVETVFPPAGLQASSLSEGGGPRTDEGGR